jgi:hypothetical protein
MLAGDYVNGPLKNLEAPAAVSRANEFIIRTAEDHMKSLSTLQLMLLLEGLAVFMSRP